MFFLLPDSVLEDNPFQDLSQPFRSLQASPALLGRNRQLEDHRQHALPGDASPGLDGAMTDRSKGLFDRVGRPDIDPVFVREVVEGHESFPVLLQAFGGLRILGLIGREEIIKGLVRFLPGLRHPDLMKIAFVLRLFGFRELVQDIRRLVHPAPLGFGGSENLGQSGPDPQRPISDRQLGIDRQSPFFQIEQQLLPGLFAFPVAVANGQKFLLPVLCRADHHQNAMVGLVHPDIEMNPVRPEINVSLLQQIQFCPLLMFRCPGLLQAPDRRGGEPRGVLSQKTGQNRVEVSGGDPPEIQPRQQFGNAFGSTEVGRIWEENRISPFRSRTRGGLTETFPNPVWIVRSGKYPFRTTLCRFFPSFNVA